MRKLNNKDKGSRFENKCKKTIASGGLWFNKTDLRYEDSAIECKYTDKKGFRITLEMLEKLWNQALDANKEPSLIIGIRRNEQEIFKLTASLQIERK